MAQVLANSCGKPLLPLQPSPDQQAMIQVLQDDLARSRTGTAPATPNSDAFQVDPFTGGVSRSARWPGSNMGTQYAMGSPANVDLPWQQMADQYTAPAPAPAPASAPQPNRAIPAAATGVQTDIDPIPGYDETGDNAWRKANDQILLNAVNRYNAANGYRPGDPGYWTADMLKAQAMVETGSDRDAFLTDPLQVNTRGNWDDAKMPIAGLTRDQAMTPQISADAALKWLQFKGHPRDHKGQPLPYIGDEGALWRYSGDTHKRSYYTRNPDDDGLNQQDWYAGTIPKLAQAAADAGRARRGSR